MPVELNEFMVNSAKINCGSPFKLGCKEYYSMAENMHSPSLDKEVSANQNLFDNKK